MRFTGSGFRLELRGICFKASRMARYLRRLSLIAGSFWFGRSFQREYTMGQPLKCLFQNAL